MTHLSQHRSSEDTDEQAHTQMYLRALSPREVGQELLASANCALRPLQLPLKTRRSRAPRRGVAFGRRRGARQPPLLTSAPTPHNRPRVPPDSERLG